jgi:hypothetical protein
MRRLCKRRCWRLREDLGDEHPDTLRSMNNLASTYRDLGRTKDAAALQEKVLEARGRILGDEHPDTLRSMNNLASDISRSRSDEGCGGLCKRRCWRLAEDLGG